MSKKVKKKSGKWAKISFQHSCLAKTKVSFSLFGQQGECQPKEPGRLALVECPSICWQGSWELSFKRIKGEVHPLHSKKGTCCALPPLPYDDQRLRKPWKHCGSWWHQNGSTKTVRQAPRWDAPWLGDDWYRDKRYPTRMGTWFDFVVVTWGRWKMAVLRHIFL